MNRSVREIFYAVLAYPAAEREDALAALCDGDDALLREVRAFLQEDAAMGSSFDEKLRGVVADSGPVCPAQELGPYVVEQQVAVGGMAEVWRIRHRQLGSVHALKLLQQSQPALRARLLAEGQILARLRHPNIVRVTDLLDIGGGGIGLVMELVEGRTLGAWLAAGPPPPAQAIAVGRDILDGMAYAHRMGLVHRDLKPDNILLEAALRPRILDFGIARSLDAGGPARTRTGMVMGTPGFMAPEQYRDASRVDARADVYALGCVLYALLTGRPPFPGGDLISAYQQALRMDFPPPRSLVPTLPESRAAAGQRAMQPQLVRRHQDATALLAAWCDAAGIPGPQPSAPPPPEVDAVPTFNLALESTTQALAAPQPPIALPALRDAFFGREPALATLSELLAEQQRLITVLGPGGMGKTRIALELAHRHAEQYPGGVWFCDLSDATTTDALHQALAEVLGVPVRAAGAAAHLGRVLAGRPGALLVLDNFEQIVDAGVPALEIWRQSAPGVTFLVTSRVVLGVAGEAVVPLEPLALPTGDEATGPAVALFAARARSRKHSFTISSANAADVAQLMRMLDGMPLAIELAAARVGVLSVRAIVARMSQRFRLLRSNRRDLPSRQSTLRGAIDWSWSLLSPWEQAAFAQVSVFRGGFTLEAAETVMDLSAFADAPWPMDAVQSLVDKSLVRRVGEDADGEPRFGMFFSLHDYATARREALSPAEHAALLQRRDRYYAGFGQHEVRDAVYTVDGLVFWKQLCAERDNIVASAEHARTTGALRDAVHAAQAAAKIYRAQGPLSAGLSLLEALLPAVEDCPAQDRAWLQTKGDFFYSLSSLYGLVHQRDDMLRLLDRAQALADATNDRAQLGRVEGLRARLARRQRQLDVAETRFRQAIAVCRSCGDEVGERSFSEELATLLKDLGRIEEGIDLMRRMLHRNQRYGNARTRAMVMARFSLLLIRSGEYADAREMIHAALALNRSLDNRHGEALLLNRLAILHYETGDLVRSRRSFERCLVAFREIGATNQIPGVLLNIGSIDLSEKKMAAAEATTRKAHQLARANNHPLNTGVALAALSAVLHEADRLEEAEEALRESLQILTAARYGSALGGYTARLGLVLLERGQTDEGEALVAKGMAVIRGLSDPMQLVHSLSLHARTRLRLGQRERVLPLVTEAEAIIAQRGLTNPNVTRRLRETRERLKATGP